MVEASGLQALVVRWLSELNYIRSTELRLFCRFEIEELTEERLAATVAGEPIDPRRHTVFTEVKAVTYHGLTVEPCERGWKAQVILDL
jgi:SHS2 domain-containing protein